MTDTFGRTIAEARIRKQKTLRSLAQELSLSASYLNDIEHGRRTPSEENVAALAHALDLSLDTLLGLAGKVGTEAEQHLKSAPSAGVLLRRGSELGITDEEYKQLLTHLNRIVKNRKPE